MAAKIDPQKILIIRTSSIGDILLASPLLRILHKKFPKAKIDFIVKQQFLDTVRSNPYIQHIFPLYTNKPLRELQTQLQNNHYDVVLDIHNNYRSKKMRKITNSQLGIVKKYKWQRFLLVKFGLNFYKKIIPVYKRYLDAADFLQLEDDNQGLEFFTDPLEKNGVEKYLRALGYDDTKTTLCIVPGAGFPTKQWPAERVVQLINKFDKEKFQIVLMGSKPERKLTDLIAFNVNAPVINLAGEMTLMQTACALQFMDICLTNDSGLMHLANALHLKTVSIFGCTVRELGFFPLGKNAVVIENENLTCRPCTHMGRKKCPKKHFKCMLEISVDRVYNDIQAHLRSGDVSLE